MLIGAMWAGRRGGIDAVNLTGPAATGWEQSQFRLTMLASDEADALKQRLGAGVAATYPCDGLGGVAATWYLAIAPTRPFPGAGSDVAYGPPVHLKADAGSVLQFGKARIARAGDAVAVACRTLSQADDPAGLLQSNDRNSHHGRASKVMQTAHEPRQSLRFAKPCLAAKVRALQQQLQQCIA